MMRKKIVFQLFSLTFFTMLHDHRNYLFWTNVCDEVYVCR